MALPFFVERSRDHNCQRTAIGGERSCVVGWIDFADAPWMPQETAQFRPGTDEDAAIRSGSVQIQPIAGGPHLIPWPDRPMAQALDELEPGQPIRSPDVLFPKLTDEQVAEWKLKFGGSAS